MNDQSAPRFELVPFLPDDKLTDEALLARLATGDEDALEELYERFGASAYGIAQVLLGEQQLAEDAVCEAFLAVHRQAPDFEPARDGRAAAWILALVHRQAAETRRRRGDETVRRPEHIAPRVGAALDRLPAQQRTLIELAYYGGLDESALCRRLSLAPAFLRRELSAALSRLGKLLREQPAHQTAEA